MRDSSVTHINLKWVSIVLVVNIAGPEHKREVWVYDPTDMNAHVMEQDWFVLKNSSNHKQLINHKHSDYMEIDTESQCNS